MRFLYTLLLSLCCVTATLQSNAIDVKAKDYKTANEYQAAEEAITNDALNDYYSVTVSGNVISTHAAQRATSHYLPGNADKNITGYILNDSFQNIPLFFSGNHAKTFRCKLIFPQHYYW